MAPALSSNSFLLNTTPHSRLLTLRTPRLTVFAKRSGPFSPFQLGKPKDDDSEETSPDAGNSNPFRFDFGKIPDMKSLIPVVNNPASGMSFGSRKKDPRTVYVAGATGLVGIRIAQMLLREGFSVRAGVPELGAAQDLALLAAKYKIISQDEARRLNAVQSTFEDAESIAKAIGNASKVVVTIGQYENGPTTEVSASDALQVIEAAQLAGVSHVAIIYDGNTTSSSTYNVLDGLSTFFNNIFSRSQPLTVSEFLQKVIETDVRYTFIKTSLTDDFSPESSYNVVVAAEGSSGINDYKVAKSQIASLVANVFSNTAVAENKVVEVSTDPSAPVKSVDELFSAIAEDTRRAVYAETLAKAKAEEAEQKAKEAEEAARQLAEQATTKAAATSDQKQPTPPATLSQQQQLDNFLNKAKDISSGLTWEKLSSQFSNGGLKPEQESESKRKPNVQVATVRGQAKARTLPALKAAVKPEVKGKKEKGEEGREVRKVFGGLFTQETIYVDED